MTSKDAANIIDHLGIKQVYDDTVSATEIGEALTLAISALENIDRITAERDAAIADMEDIAKKVNVNCRYCKNLSEKNKLLRNETMRESKCFNCECFSSWEWRGARND